MQRKYKVLDGCFRTPYIFWNKILVFSQPSTVSITLQVCVLSYPFGKYLSKHSSSLGPPSFFFHVQKNLLLTIKIYESYGCPWHILNLPSCFNSVTIGIRVSWFWSLIDLFREQYSNWCILTEGLMKLRTRWRLDIFFLWFKLFSFDCSA